MRVGALVEDLAIDAVAHSEAEVGDRAADVVAVADQDRSGQALGDDLLCGLQHVRVLALGVDDAPRVLGRGAAGLVEDRLHDEAGLVDEPGQALAVGVEVLDRAGCDAGFHRGLGDGRGDLGNQARIERLRV